MPQSILTKSHDILRRHKRATISRWLHFVRSRVISDEQSLHGFAHAATAMLSLWVWVQDGLIVGKDIMAKQIFRRLRVDGGNVHKYLEVFLRIVLTDALV